MGAAEEKFSCDGASVFVFPLAWEFLQAVSGAVAKESSQGSAYRGEPSLDVFRGVVF